MRKKKYKINNCQKVKYESECTYLHIDLFNLGYSKKLLIQMLEFHININIILKGNIIIHFYSIFKIF